MGYALECFNSIKKNLGYGMLINYVLNASGRNAEAFIKDH